MLTPEKRTRLEAGLANGDGPTRAGLRGKAMYVGGIMLANAQGDLTPAGRAWIELGGDDPYRYRGEVATSGTGRTKCVMDNGHRVTVLKLHAGPNGPEFRPMPQGLLRNQAHEPLRGSHPRHRALQGPHFPRCRHNHR